MSRLTRWLAGAASAALLTGLAVPAVSHADDTPEIPATTNAASTKAAADWIAGQWKPANTQFAAGLADSIIALGAAEAHSEVVSEMVAAMVTAAPAYVSGPDSLAKVLIALDAAGQDTQHFLGCGRDLEAELDAFVEANGKNLDAWWGPHLISIALNRLDKPVPQNVFDLLMKRQKDDGRFGYPDDTGLALMALVGIFANPENPQDMRATAKTAIDRVVAWSQDPANQKQKQKDGPYYWTSFSPANSTGMLAGALAEADKDITSPQTFMRALQLTSGAWSSTLNGTTNNMMSTTQGIFAVAGKAYGTASFEVPRTTEVCPAKPVFTTQPSSTTITAGGTATFSVVTTGVPTPAITWQKDVKGIWTSIADVTGATLTLKEVGLESNGLVVRAVGTNSKGSATSESATLTVKRTVITPPVTTPPTTTTPPVTTPPTTTPPVTTPPTTTPPVTAPPVTTPPALSYPGDIYSTPGYHAYNGRNWFTSCEAYSVTKRCRTLIQAKAVSQVGGTFVTSQKWVFNNLTYLPSARSVWKNNPLAATGSWIATDGRQWRTECDTAVTGRNGCRTYVTAKVIDNTSKAGQPVQYGWTTKETLNNIVQFS